VRKGNASWVFEATAITSDRKGLATDTREHYGVKASKRKQLLNDSEIPTTAFKKRRRARVKGTKERLPA